MDENESNHDSSSYHNPVPSLLAPPPTPIHGIIDNAPFFPPEEATQNINDDNDDDDEHDDENDGDADNYDDDDDDGRFHERSKRDKGLGNDNDDDDNQDMENDKNRNKNKHKNDDQDDNTSLMDIDPDENLDIDADADKEDEEDGDDINFYDHPNRHNRDEFNHILGKVEKLNYAQLRAILKKNSLPAAGKKKDLQNTLFDFWKQQQKGQEHQQLPQQQQQQQQQDTSQKQNNDISIDNSQRLVNTPSKSGITTRLRGLFNWFKPSPPPAPPIASSSDPSLSSNQSFEHAFTNDSRKNQNFVNKNIFDTVNKVNNENNISNMEVDFENEVGTIDKQNNISHTQKTSPSTDDAFHNFEQEAQIQNPDIQSKKQDRRDYNFDSKYTLRTPTQRKTKRVYSPDTSSPRKRNFIASVSKRQHSNTSEKNSDINSYQNHSKASLISNDETPVDHHLDVQNLSYHALKRECKKRGLQTTGKKQVLQDRILESNRLLLENINNNDNNSVHFDVEDSIIPNEAGTPVINNNASNFADATNTPKEDKRTSSAKSRESKKVVSEKQQQQIPSQHAIKQQSEEIRTENNLQNRSIHIETKNAINDTHDHRHFSPSKSENGRKEKDGFTSNAVLNSAINQENLVEEQDPMEKVQFAIQQIRKDRRRITRKEYDEYSRILLASLAPGDEKTPSDHPPSSIVPLVDEATPFENFGPARNPSITFNKDMVQPESNLASVAPKPPMGVNNMASSFFSQQLPASSLNDGTITSKAPHIPGLKPQSTGDFHFLPNSKVQDTTSHASIENRVIPKESHHKRRRISVAIGTSDFEVNKDTILQQETIKKPNPVRLNPSQELVNKSLFPTSSDIIKTFTGFNRSKASTENQTPFQNQKEEMFKNVPGSAFGMYFSPGINVSSGSRNSRLKKPIRLSLSTQNPPLVDIQIRNNVYDMRSGIADHDVLKHSSVVTSNAAKNILDTLNKINSSRIISGYEKIPALHASPSPSSAFRITNMNNEKVSKNPATIAPGGIAITPQPNIRVNSILKTHQSKPLSLNSNRLEKLRKQVLEKRMSSEAPKENATPGSSEKSKLERLREETLASMSSHKKKRANDYINSGDAARDKFSLVIKEKPPMYSQMNDFPLKFQKPPDSFNFAKKVDSTTIPLKPTKSDFASNYRNENKVSEDNSESAPMMKDMPPPPPRKRAHEDEENKSFPAFVPDQNAFSTQSPLQSEKLFQVNPLANKTEISSPIDNSGTPTMVEEKTESMIKESILAENSPIFTTKPPSPKNMFSPTAPAATDIVTTREKSILEPKKSDASTLGKDKYVIPTDSTTLDKEPEQETKADDKFTKDSDDQLSDENEKAKKPTFSFGQTSPSAMGIESSQVTPSPLVTPSKPSAALQSTLAATAPAFSFSGSSAAFTSAQSPPAFSFSSSIASFTFGQSASATNSSKPEQGKMSSSAGLTGEAKKPDGTIQAVVSQTEPSSSLLEDMKQTPDKPALFTFGSFDSDGEKTVNGTTESKPPNFSFPMSGPSVFDSSKVSTAPVFSFGAATTTGQSSSSLSIKPVVTSVVVSGDDTTKKKRSAPDTENAPSMSPVEKAPTVMNGGFSFGGSSTPFTGFSSESSSAFTPFSAAYSNGTENVTAPFKFGSGGFGSSSSAIAASGPGQSTPAFIFGQSTVGTSASQSAAGFIFGANSGSTQPGNFTFELGNASSQGNSFSGGAFNSTFSVGQSSSFVFGAGSGSTPTPSAPFGNNSTAFGSGGFTFGANTGASQSGGFTFGGTVSAGQAGGLGSSTGNVFGTQGHPNQVSGTAPVFGSLGGPGNSFGQASTGGNFGMTTFGSGSTPNAAAPVFGGFGNSGSPPAPVAGGFSFGGNNNGASGFGAPMGGVGGGEAGGGFFPSLGGDGGAGGFNIGSSTANRGGRKIVRGRRRLNR